MIAMESAEGRLINPRLSNLICADAGASLPLPRIPVVPLDDEPKPREPKLLDRLLERLGEVLEQTDVSYLCVRTAPVNPDVSHPMLHTFSARQKKGPLIVRVIGTRSETNRRFSNSPKSQVEYFATRCGSAPRKHSAQCAHL